MPLPRSPKKNENSSTQQPSISEFFASLDNAGKPADASTHDSELRTPMSLNKKRKFEFEGADSEKEMMMMLKEIHKDGQESKIQLSEMRNELKEKFSCVDANIQEIKSRMENVDAKVESTVDEMKSLKLKMNDLEQKSLANHMEITGINEEEYKLVKQDPKRGTKQIFSKLRLAHCKDPAHVIATELRDKKFKMTLIFEKLEDKIEAMRMKREMKERTEIFFNDALTPTNRRILYLAKKQAKAMATKAFVKSGKVYILEKDGKLTRISSEEELQVTAQQLPVTWNTADRSSAQ